MQKKVFVIFCLVLLLGLVSNPAHSTQAEGIEAFSRAGQTFITWDQVVGEGYEFKIYRSTAPITNSNDLAGATVLAIVWDSTAFNQRASLRTDSLYTFVIEEGEPTLPFTKGLFVYTAAEDDTAFYVVTSIIEGIEDTTIQAYPGGNTTPDGIEEIVATPRPVLQISGNDSITNHSDYVFWTDDVGREDFPAMSNVPGVPVNFRIMNDLGDTLAQPLNVWLHGGGKNFRAPSRMGGSQVLTLKVDDPKLTFPYPEKLNDYWFGFNSNYSREEPLEEGINYNYVERSLLFCINWTLENFSVDSNRVFIVGNSMGACGAVSFGLRHPEIFTCILATKPQLDFSDPQWWGHSHLDAQWGTLEQNIPTDEGIGVYDRMNAILYVGGREYTDLPIVFCFFGKFDGQVDWEEKVIFMNLYQETHHQGYFYWDETEHGPLGTWGTEMQYRYDQLLNYRLDQSYPALTSLSINDDPGDGDPAVGDTVGTYGAYVTWDPSTIIDTGLLYQVTIMLDDYDPNFILPSDSATVNVTPRRLQQFSIYDGQRYLWTNKELEGGNIIQTGEFFGGSRGQITIEDFVVKTAGNRLTILRGYHPSWLDPHMF